MIRQTENPTQCFVTEGVHPDGIWLLRVLISSRRAHCTSWSSVPCPLIPFFSRSSEKITVIWIYLSTLCCNRLSQMSTVSSSSIKRFLSILTILCIYSTICCRQVTASGYVVAMHGLASSLRIYHLMPPDAHVWEPETTVAHTT